MELSKKLKAQMGEGWAEMLRKFVESEEMDKLFSYIKQRSKVSRLCPKSEDLWRAFKLCQPDKVRVIICGISPYHTWTEGKDKGIPVADGLALSCSHTADRKGLQPSLEQVYNSMELDYNDGKIDTSMIRNGDLSYLAKQGVLLYNVALTVEEGKACSMNDAWAKFNEYLWKEVVNTYMKGIVIILLGQQSWKSEQYIAPMLHYTYKLSHPASAAYKGDNWNSEGIWKKVNQILEQNNGPENKINWYEKVPF